MDHPKKKDDDALRAWIEGELRPRIDACHADPPTLVLFTDGSAHLDERRSAAGYEAYVGGKRIRSHAVQTGAAHSYYAELMPLYMAIGFARLKSLHTAHIFTENEASAKAVLDVSVHAGQPFALNACRILREWFEHHPDNTLHISYYPSHVHVGIRENESVDLLVGQIANSDARGTRLRGPIPETLSFANARTAAALREGWAADAQAKPDVYFGRDYPKY